MELRVIDELQMDAVMEAAVRAALQACFPRDREHYGRTRDWHGSAPAWTVVLQEGEAVVAHVGVVDRRIRVGGQPLRVFGPQGVCVRPEHRGKRLVDKVLSAAVDEARRREIQWGMLFCQQATMRIYARTGWQEVDRTRITRIDADGAEGPLPEGSMPMVRCAGDGQFPLGPIHLAGNDW